MITLLNCNSLNGIKNSLKESVRNVCANIQTNRKTSYDVLSKEMLAYVDENFSDAMICLDAVADQFNLSIYSVSRIFKDTIGMEFRKYIISRRIEYAKSLLFTSDKNIKDIAVEVGFSDPAYNGKFFQPTIKYPTIHIF